MPNTHSLDLERVSSQSAFITDAGQTGLELTGDFTVEAWLNLESAPPTDDGFVIVSKWVATGNLRNYTIAVRDVSGAKKYRITTTTDGTNGTKVSGDIASTYVVGTWIHFAVAFDVSAGSAEFYENGVSIGTVSSLNTSTADTASRFEIGGLNEAGGNMYDGLIDEVRIWSDIRTSTEIGDNYELELIGNEAGLVAYWELDNDYLDQTANNNDLTAVNTPVFSTDIPDWSESTAPSANMYIIL